MTAGTVVITGGILATVILLCIIAVLCYCRLQVLWELGRRVGGGWEGSPEGALQREGGRAQEGGRVRSPRRCKADGTPGLHL